MTTHRCENCGITFTRTEDEVSSKKRDLYFQRNYKDFCDSCMKLLDYHGKYVQDRSDGVLRLNLLENAFDYLNTSIGFVIEAEKNGTLLPWKHATINLVLAIELFLKELLRQTNPLLVYADLDHYQKIDRSTKTVSWTVAIERVKLVANDRLARIDLGRLRKAQILRNQMLHYDVEFSRTTCLNDFADLLDFTKSLFAEFFEMDLSKPIEKFLYPQNWEQEAIITKYFGDTYTVYNGYAVYKSFIEEQKFRFIILDGEKFERIRFGDEPSFRFQTFNHGYYENFCHDCDAVAGLFHGLGCDVEVCPKCRGQLLSCGCVNILGNFKEAEKALRTE